MISCGAGGGQCIGKDDDSTLVKVDEYSLSTIH